VRSAHAADRAKAAWLLSPHSIEEFESEYFERKPLHISRGDAAYYDRYFSLQEFERIMCGCELRSSFVKVVKDGTLARPESYVVAKEKRGDDKELSQFIEPDRLSAMLAGGCSLVLDRAAKFSPSLSGLCRELELYFRCNINPNVYFTPPDAQGFALHYDTHDTAIIQVAGTKHWRVYDSAFELPLEHQNFDKKVHSASAEPRELEMKPGDFLYLPRGFLHEARSTDEISLHVTLGLYPPLWIEVLRETLTAAAESDGALRKTSQPQHDGEIAALLQEILTPESFERARASINDRFLSERRNVLDGQIAQMAALKALSEDSRVALRRSVLYRLEHDERATKVHFSGKTLTFGPNAAGLIAELSNVESCSVRALLKHDEHALKIVRRLIQEGFAVQLTPASEAGGAVA
jgi:ribosomal protein L16 Arg81 hydroxylase